jgi:hypothetical protein
MTVHKRTPTADDLQAAMKLGAEMADAEARLMLTRKTQQAMAGAPPPAVAREQKRRQNASQDLPASQPPLWVNPGGYPQGLLTCG